MKAFFDTSVLLGGLIEFGAPSDPAQTLFEALASRRLGRPMTAWHCCLEFYAVATRLPEEYRLTPGDALTLLESEVLGRFSIVDLAPPARRPFLESSARDQVRGGRLYDAHIAEIARRAGARVIVTENLRHFTGLERSGIKVLRAADALPELLA